ncbi:MAG: Formiminotransferase domain protein [Acidimicrobiales bacterium]|nr:Formiminotransferase domain protein [Acidimicrobiales bacterium]
MLECVVNISEGRDNAVIAAIAAAAGDDLLDVHSDPHHHRSVLTLVGERAARAVACEAVARIDLRRHAGVHPRLGAVDVVPFVPLDGSDLAEATEARQAFGAWAAEELALPCFAYGPERSLPEVRRRAFVDLAPDHGPDHPHPSAGAVAVGARPALVAYNVWLTDANLATAKAVAAAVRRRGVRTLGLAVGDRVQVSMNLVDPEAVGPAAAADAVAAHVAIDGCELVGLLPRAVLEAVPEARWAELDVGPERTIEARLAARCAGDAGGAGGASA